MSVTTQSSQSLLEFFLTQSSQFIFIVITVEMTTDIGGGRFALWQADTF